MSTLSVPENFSFNCEVMAGFFASEDEYGTKGILFPSLYEQNQWMNGIGRVIGLRSAGCFVSFMLNHQNDSVTTYRAVGSTANAAIGYPASDSVSVEQYWIDWYGNEVDYDTGNGPYERTVHSEQPTSIDLSGSEGNSVAFSPLSNSSGHNASYFPKYSQYYYQYGDMPAAGSSTIHMSGSGTAINGLPYSYNHTSTFSFPSSTFNPDTPEAREYQSSLINIQSGDTFNGFRGNPPPTILWEFSGSFTYEPAYFFNHA